MKRQVLLEPNAAYCRMVSTVGQDSLLEFDRDGRQFDRLILLLYYCIPGLRFAIT